MSDTLKLALRISAIDLFSGVLRRFRSEIVGSGKDVQEMQQRYDRMLSHTAAGLKSLAVGGYLAAKLKPAVAAAAGIQESMLSIESILQGAHPNAAKLANQMQRVKDNAVEVSRHTKYSAKAVLDVTRQLVQGGVPLNAILDRTVNGKLVRGTAFNVEVLAETQHADPAQTALNIANVGHSFQLRPEQYAHAVDVIARGAVTSSGTLQQLFHNLDQVGSRAHMYGGMDLKSTVIALKALAPLGDEAGSDLGEALSRLTGGSYRGRKWMKQSGFDFYDKKGNFIGLDAALLQIQKRTSKMTQEQRNKMLGLLFGQTGGKAITQLLAPSLPGVKSYWEIKQSLDQQASLSQQNKTVMRGLSMSLESLASTNQTTLAAMFDPMLGKMTEAIKKAKQLDGALGDIATKHRGVADTASIGATTAIVAASGYGIYRLIRGGAAGAPLLKKFLRGTGSVATGVAEGKAIEKLTGVVPVFVTNFPGGTFVAGSGAAAEAASVASGAKTAEAGAIAARVARGARGFAMSDVLLAAGLAYALKPIKAFFDPIKDKEYAGIRASGDSAMAKHLGLNAQQYARYNAIEAQSPYGKWSKSHPDQATFFHGFENYENWAKKEAITPSAEVSGTIHIQIDQQGRALVKQLHSDNPRVHLDVGTMMTMP